MSDLLKVEGLFVQYETEDGIIKALNDVNFSLGEGETLGLVGETGAGKTTLAKSIMRLVPNPPGKIMSGKIIYDNNDILQLNISEIRKIRGNHISMIFQDPMTSLNPVMQVGEQIAETILTHEKISKKEAYEKANEMLELVGINSDRASNYPHEFSGGMKQRVVIAIALACNPKILIADEPTTALDVTIQAQVLEMMQDLKEKFKTAILLITHDLGVVAQTCQKVAIIYAGSIVEFGTVSEIFHNMSHPYTIGLMGSIPNIYEDVERLNPIKGLMPDPAALPRGCAFYPRCSNAMEICKNEKPKAFNISKEHYVCCFHTEQNYKNKGSGGDNNGQ